jgi:hypothetical protein
MSLGTEALRGIQPENVVGHVITIHHGGLEPAGCDVDPREPDD